MTEHGVPGPKPEIGFEKSDARPSAILRFLLWLLFGTIAVFILMRWMFVGLAAYEERQQPPPPIMNAGGTPEAPLPRLQARPVEELARYRAEQQKILHGYGWMDQQKGIVHIDIDDAMRLVAERGLPLEGGESPKPEAPKPEGRKE